MNRLGVLASVMLSAAVALTTADAARATTLPPVTTNRADLLNAQGYAFALRTTVPRGRVSAVLAVSAMTYTGCQSLRLIPADDPATSALEVAALIVSPANALCTSALGEDVATLDFAYPPLGRVVRVLGRNGVLSVTLPPLPPR